MRLTRASTACATNVGEGPITAIGCSAGTGGGGRRVTSSIQQSWATHPTLSHPSTPLRRCVGEAYLIEQDQLP